MPHIRVELDPETATRLQDYAIAHRRRTDDEAAILLRLALGLPYPLPSVRQKDPDHDAAPAR